MAAGYSQPPPPNAGSYDPYQGHQTLGSQSQPSYGNQPYFPQAYSAAPAPHSQAVTYQEGSSQAYPGTPSTGYGAASSRLPVNTSSQYPRGNRYGYDRPQKRGRDHGEYPRKRSSGYQSRQSYQTGPPQDMRLSQNCSHGYPPPNSSSPPYQISSPSQSYLPVSQYPPSPYPQHPPPAGYPPPPSHGYQPTSGPPPPNQSTVNGYSQSYPQASPNFEQYSAPPPPAAYSESTKNPYPNQHTHSSAQGQISYPNQAPYQGQAPYSYTASASIPPPDDYTPVNHPHGQPPRLESGSYSQYNPYGPSQWEMPQSASETPSAGQGTGYDYTVPSERADEDVFVFPLGPEGQTLGGSDEYFVAMRELDEERFSWDGALHPLPNEPIDPNFSIGKAGIITMHFAEAIRYPLAPSIEADNDARNNRPLLTSPIINVISRYADEEGRLILDCPHSDDPVFNIPNQRLDELVSVQNARLFLDAKDDEVEDVMTSLDNALNGNAADTTFAGPEWRNSISIEETKPALDPDTERMLADLGVSGPGFGEASHPPGPARSVSPTQACPPSPPMHHEFHEPHHEYREPHQEYREPPREYRETYREYVDWPRDYPPHSPTPRMTPPPRSPYPNGRRDSNGTAPGSDFGPQPSPSPQKSAPPPPPPQKAEDKENPLKRKQSDDFDPPGGTVRRRKSKPKGADTGSIYGRRD